MKLQIDGQSLRIRVSEAEFAQLLEWDSVQMRTALPERVLTLTLRPVAGGPMTFATDADGWRLDLPLSLLVGYRDRLPCRDALTGEQALPDGGTLTLAFEVDVRDSVRVRGPRR